MGESDKSGVGCLGHGHVDAQAWDVACECGVDGPVAGVDGGMVAMQGADAAGGVEESEFAEGGRVGLGGDEQFGADGFESKLREGEVFEKDGVVFGQREVELLIVAGLRGKPVCLLLHEVFLPGEVLSFGPCGHEHGQGEDGQT